MAFLLQKQPLDCFTVSYWMNIFHFFVLSRCDIIELNSPKSCVQETATSIRCKVLVLHTQKKKSDNGTWCCAWQCFTLLLVAFVIIYQAVVKKILESVVDKIQRHLPQLIHETFLICQNLDIHAGRQLCENKLSLWIYRFSKMMPGLILQPWERENWLY